MRQAELDPLLGFALFADDVADSLQLIRHPRIGTDDVVERVGDLAVQPDPVLREANREVAVAHGDQRSKECAGNGGGEISS